MVLTQWTFHRVGFARARLPISKQTDIQPIQRRLNKRLNLFENARLIAFRKEHLIKAKNILGFLSIFLDVKKLESLVLGILVGEPLHVELLLRKFNYGLRLPYFISITIPCS